MNCARERPCWKGRPIFTDLAPLRCSALTPSRKAFEAPRAVVGPQAERIGATAVWVLPNPSGINAHYQRKTGPSVFGSAYCRQLPGFSTPSMSTLMEPPRLNSLCSYCRRTLACGVHAVYSLVLPVDMELYIAQGEMV